MTTFHRSAVSASASIAAIGLLFPFEFVARADHGPGTSRVAAATQSVQTMKPGHFSFEVRTEYTEFEHLSATQIAAKAQKAGEFDLLDRSFVSSVSVGYGIIEDLQVGLTIGYYNAVRARTAEYDSGT